MSSLIIRRRPRGFQKKTVIVIVGRNIEKGAAKRNLFKRRLRAILRSVVEVTRADYTVIAKPGTTKLSYKELKQEIEKALQ